MSSADRAFLAVCVHGLRVKVDDVPNAMAYQQLRILRRLLRSVDLEQVIDAARYGMSKVWPFNDGRTWDADDLQRNILKAMGEAAKSRRRNEVPVNAQELAR